MFPACVLSYTGQGALVLEDPSGAEYFGLPRDGTVVMGSQISV